MDAPILGELIDIRVLLVRRADLKQKVWLEMPLGIQGVFYKTSQARIGDDEKGTDKITVIDPQKSPIKIFA